MKSGLPGKSRFIEIDTEGFEADLRDVVGALAVLERRGFLIELLTSIRDKVMYVNLYNKFRTKGKGTWAPLNPLYLQYKTRRGLHRRVGLATGAMWRTLTGHGMKHPITAEGISISKGGAVPYDEYFNAGWIQHTSERQRRFLGALLGIGPTKIEMKGRILYRWEPEDLSKMETLCTQFIERNLIEPFK
jgi:hypothetical protein